MALPKNKKIRKITVDNIEYYWTIQYDQDYGLVTCNVGLVDKPNYRFCFIRGTDSSHVRYIHNSIDEKDEVEAITPKLIRESIIFANENIDWQNKADCIIYSDSRGFSSKN